VDYVRSWWATDGISRTLIERTGRLDPVLIKSIGVEYNVYRGITDYKAKSNKRGDKGLTDVAVSPSRENRTELVQRLCAHFNNEAQKWPTGMLPRAKHCREIMLTAMAMRCFADQQIAGTTKFMWFLRLGGWTPYDDLAASGTGAEGKNTVGRMEEFYIRLARRLATRVRELRS
jgi:hypothetical protein